MKSNIKFANEKVKKALEDLEKDDFKFYQFILRAFNDIQENCFCGVQIPKKLIPNEYNRRFGELTNLWKYNLPDA